jgi:hypothetical protein
MPKNLIGFPVTSLIDSAEPPRASPSSLVKMKPSMPMRRLNSAAVRTASWPIIASQTNKTLSGEMPWRIDSSSVISCSSMANRPAVSTITTSIFSARAFSQAFLASSGGCRPASKNTGTCSFSPKTFS